MGKKMFDKKSVICTVYMRYFDHGTMIQLTNFSY